MVCYFPLKGYASRDRSKTGGRAFTFSIDKGFIDRPMSVPCGKCIGCRIDRSRSWALRCMHEASLYDHNCFITLTYSNDFIPEFGSLSDVDFTLFMKRFRKRFSDVKIRYFQCGEYGDKLQRPHHHACIFNFDFPDRVHWSTRDGVMLFRSKILESLWPYGFSTVGDVTEQSAAYVARYVLKKVVGTAAPEFYRVGVDFETGEVFSRKPEFITMSRRPGIGYDWFKKFGSDVYPDDFVINSKGLLLKPPRYYDTLFDDAGGNYEEIKIFRRNKANRRKEDNSSQRLEVRHQIQVLRSKKLIRSFENDI